MKTVALLLLMLVSHSALATPPQTVHLGFEVMANPPYYLGTDTIDWEKPGITLEVLKLLEQRLNIKLVFTRMPWARALRELNDNRIDGLFHASYQRQREAFGVFPMKNGQPDSARRIMQQSYVLYKRAQSPLTWDGEHFGNLSGPLGSIIDYAIVEDLQDHNVEVFEARTQRNNLRMLAAGHLEGVVGLETMNDHIIQSDPDTFAGIVKVTPPVATKSYYLMFSHGFVEHNPELAEAIWGALEDVRINGDYQAIAQKYQPHPE